MDASATTETQPDEQICDSFVCCVCLELLYKPIVLACGHVSCFWCVHRSMNGLRESHCPICRHPYHHFPTICEMLHFLLLKMYPVTYKRRETLILELEKENDCFSPEINDPVCASHSGDELNLQGDPVSSDLAVEENMKSKKDDGTQMRVSVTDVPCIACKELLFRPVVLNCGHVYCETCIGMAADEKLRCQVCQSFHPNGFPKVCLELHHFLETQFPTEYELRRNRVKQVVSQQDIPATCSEEAGKQGGHVSFTSDGNFWPSWGDHHSNVHCRVGCDFCGMYPIVGNRYRCKDCVEVIGFDLCGDCYNTRSKLPGRFNQQHTPEHNFEIVRSNSIRSMILRLIRGQVEESGISRISTRVVLDAAAPNLPESDLENPEYVIVENPENVIPPAVDDVEETADSEPVNRPTSSSVSEDQNEQSPST